MKRGKLVVFCGPSGSGKGTISKNFLSLPEFNFHFSISATTRKKRENEIDGIHYYFLEKIEFKNRIKNNEFLEYAQFIDDFYGTPIKSVEEKLSQGYNVFLEIELLGVKQIIEKMPESTTIFLSPPSIEELERRLINRGTESKDVIFKRINRAIEELNEVDIFKYNVINDNVEEASSKIISILRKELK